MFFLNHRVIFFLRFFEKGVSSKKNPNLEARPKFFSAKKLFSEIRLIIQFWKKNTILKKKYNFEKKYNFDHLTQKASDRLDLDER